MKEPVKTHKKGLIRRVISDLLILFIVIFTIYLCVIMQQKIDSVVLKDTYRKIYHYELFICAVLFLFSLDTRFSFFTCFRSRILCIPGTILRLIVTLLSLIVIFFAGKVISGSFINTAGKADNAIVLGMALQNGKPSNDLDLRLDTAKRYSEENPEAVLILSGGNPDDSGLTEAGVMHMMLKQSGVPENRMILEEKSTSTRENFENTAKLVDVASPVVLITSSYHMDRAVMMAKDAGFENILCLPSPSDPLQYGSNVMWEVILEINEMI